jgi:tetratricopeptide (TPR) repeat protein
MKKILLTLLVIAALIIAVGCANKYATSGKIAMKGKNYEKAIHDFNLALEADSSNGEIHFLLGEAYKNQKDFIAMNRHYETASRLSPKYNEQIGISRDSVWGEFFKTGIEKAKGEKFQEALKDFQMAIAIQPEHYEAFTNAGYAFQNMADIDSSYIDSAYSYYQRALKIDQSNINVMLNFANLSLGLGKIDMADSIFGAIIEKDPNHVDAIIKRGEIADQKGNYEQAVNFYNKALQLKPDECGVWFNLGVVYFQRMQKKEDAEQAFTRASDLCPDDVNAKVNLAVLLISNNRFDEAIARLNAFTADHPDECVGWDLLAQALSNKGQREEAMEADKKYKECSQKP